MWLRAHASPHAADALQATPASGSHQVKVAVSRSCGGGLGSARQVQRGCVTTVIGRCQQGANVSASPAHGLDEQAVPAVSTGVQQAAQMLHLQQAPALTAALDLQPSRQHLQHAQHQQHQQQDDTHAGPAVHWLSNGHGGAEQYSHRQLEGPQGFLPGHSQPPARQQEHLPLLQQQQQPPEVPLHHYREQQQQQQQGGTQGADPALRQPAQQPPPAVFEPQRALPKHLQPVQRQKHQPSRVSSPVATPGAPQQQQPQQQRRRQAQPRQQQQQQQQTPPDSKQQPQLHPAQLTVCIQQRGTVQELELLHQRYGSAFNPINMSALLVRLARLHSTQPDQLPAAQALALQVSQQLLPRLHECSNARQAANAVWALAVLQCAVPLGLLQSAAQQLAAQQGQLLQASQPQDIANLAWGLAKLQHNPACSCWQHVVAAAQRQLVRFKPGECAMLLWALADTQQRLQQLHKRQRHRQQHQQQQQQLRQLQSRRQLHAQQQQQSYVDGSSSSRQQSPAELRRPSEQQQGWLSAQQAARRQSNAEASTSAAASIKAAYLAARRAGSSSSSTGAGSRRMQVQAVRPEAGPSLPAAQGQGAYQQTPSSTTSTSSSSANGSSSAHRAHNSSAGAVQGRPVLAPFQQQLQELLSDLAEVLPRQLEAGQQQYGAREGAMLLWACGVLGCADDRLLGPLAALQQRQLQEGRSKSQDVANSVWALAKLQVVQPQLLAAAGEHTAAWLAHSSAQELSQVLHGTAAVIRQQRLQRAGSSELLPAVTLWQAAAAQALTGPGVLLGLGVAEAATLLQAAALMLEPLRQPGARWRQQQQRQQQQQQQQQDASDGSAQAGVVSPASPVVSVSSPFNSMCSQTCSMDSFDEAVVAAPTQAWQLIAAVDAELCQQAQGGQLPLPLSGEHVAPMLHALAAAGAVPSQALQQLLVAGATAAAPSMDSRELALTAWSAAKLLGGSRRSSDDNDTTNSTSSGSSSEGVQGLMEAVDRAAGPLLSCMTPQDLSMLAWAHGKLWDLGDSLFMHTLVQAALGQVQAFGPQALSNLTWACAQLRHYDAALTSAVGRRARALLGQFTPAELSNLTWALVTLRHRQAGLLRAIASHAAGACGSWDPKACVKLAVSYCSRGMPTHRYRFLLGALADSLAARPARAWSRLTPHELVQLAVAFAVGRVRHRACCAQIAGVALAWLPRLALHDVVSLVWALAMVGQPHDALLQAVSVRVASELQASVSGLQHLQQLQQQLQQHQGAARLGSSSSPHAAVQDTLQQSQQHQHQQQPIEQGDGSGPGPSSSSSPLAGVPIYAVLGSKLHAPHLARLAWAYKTFAHADAGWYLAAGQLLATAWEPPSGIISSSRMSSSMHSSSGSTGHLVSSSSSSDGSSNGGSTSRPTGSTMPGGVRAAGSDGLQRPLHRPVPAPASAPDM